MPVPFTWPARSIGTRVGPRLKGDPYKFVRVVKGGIYQARPYCDIERERYNLGLFRTPDQAVTAIRKFWATGKGDRPKFVRPVRCKGGRVYFKAVVQAAGGVFDLHRFDTSDEAAAAVRGFLVGKFGDDRAAALMRRK